MSSATPCGKDWAAKQPPKQLDGRALHRGHRHLVRVERPAGADDPHLDADLLPRRGRADRHEARADAAAAVIHLGLRQVERVRALDAARGHVVAEDERLQLSVRPGNRAEFRLGHVPVRVSPDAELLSGADRGARRSLDEQLRPPGAEDSIVNVAAVDGLFPPRLAAAGEGHAGGPHGLQIQWCQNGRLAGHRP